MATKQDVTRSRGELRSKLFPMSRRFSARSRASFLSSGQYSPDCANVGVKAGQVELVDGSRGIVLRETNFVEKCNKRWIPLNPSSNSDPEGRT